MSFAIDGRTGGRAVGAVLVGSLLTACAPAPRPEAPAAARIVPLAPAAAREQVDRALRAAGFATVVLDGGAVPTLRGELGGGADPDWAHCPGIWTTDPFSDVGQSRFVQPENRRAVIVVRASSLPQGTSVEIDLRTIGLYRHAFTGDIVEAPCPSSGLLERRILDALGGVG